MKLNILDFIPTATGLLRRKLVIALLIMLPFVTAEAQMLQSVKWSTKTERLSDTEFNLVFEATIDAGWHVYSQFTPADGPLPLELDFKEKEGNYSLIGKTAESKTKREFNDVFGVDEIFFSDRMVLKQKVKITNTAVRAIEVSVSYQVCLDKCLNEEKKFRFAIPAITSLTQGTAQTTAVTTVTTPAVVVDSIQTETVSKVPKAAILTTTDLPAEEQDMGLFTIFFLAFLSGLAALLTPCVFPLIPMTVSYFTKQSKNRAAGIKNAIIYGVSIIVIYVVLGLLVTAIFGADALNSLATNVWFNLIFFVLLIVFALSFLGAFEIMLPNSWANKVDRQADRGGIIGILFMALALAIVTFSCTGPFVGNLLVLAATHGGIAPVVGMLGFSMALALPFMLFAMFPGWLNSLPKSGGWLNTVKVFLGFLELALAFKFLSNADLVLQLHLLEREVFLAIWIAIFATLALYLFGKITLPHDGPLPFISVGRLMLGLLVLTFTIYLVPGLWGAPLKLISAFPPPMTYSESPDGLAGARLQEVLPEGAEKGPHGLAVFTDYDKGMAYAKTVNKPVMLDFTGFACVNCRKMENNVWSDSQVLPILKNEVVLISLFVDDKRDLPKSEHTVSKTTGADITSVGDKWTDFMISKYKTNTQPLYVLTDTDGTNLNTATPTISYVDVNAFSDWLKTGISNFRK